MNFISLVEAFANAFAWISQVFSNHKSCKQKERPAITVTAGNSSKNIAFAQSLRQDNRGGMRLRKGNGANSVIRRGPPAAAKNMLQVVSPLLRHSFGKRNK
ncbi:hypothetical protein AVEN_45481-1 [Araneus ventricosus]|uniref:Uncharacterized protein n=1 Tax=Araneus ventricosus TaxID=182803 RepID=A0A4Y2MBN6_ARAVE|nr:hypothetical protein AVEN_45481-1 [Araneus ventricosus]